MRVMIKVTADDIANGKQCDIEGCPMALAMTRKLGQRVFVGTSTYFLNIVPHKEYALPRKAYDFIENFDTCEPVSPFTFRLELEDGKEVEV